MSQPNGIYKITTLHKKRKCNSCICATMSIMAILSGFALIGFAIGYQYNFKNESQRKCVIQNIYVYNETCIAKYGIYPCYNVYIDCNNNIRVPILRQSVVNKDNILAKYKIKTSYTICVPKNEINYMGFCRHRIAFAAVLAILSITFMCTVLIAALIYKFGY